MLDGMDWLESDPEPEVEELDVITAVLIHPDIYPHVLPYNETFGGRKCTALMVFVSGIFQNAKRLQVLKLLENKNKCPAEDF